MPVLDGRCAEANVDNRIHLPTEPVQAKLAAVCRFAFIGSAPSRCPEAGISAAFSRFIHQAVALLPRSPDPRSSAARRWIGGKSILGLRNQGEIPAD